MDDRDVVKSRQIVSRMLSGMFVRDCELRHVDRVLGYVIMRRGEILRYWS